MVLGSSRECNALNFFQYNSYERSVRLQIIFLSEQPFYGNYSSLDSHTNTVIFHAFAYSSTEMASKTVARAINLTVIKSYYGF